MAFEGDKCDMCKEADKQLEEIIAELDCAKVNVRQMLIMTAVLSYFI